MYYFYCRYIERLIEVHVTSITGEWRTTGGGGAALSCSLSLSALSLLISSTPPPFPSYQRSTMVGASNLALALGTSTVFVGPIGTMMARFKAFINAHPMAGVLLVLNFHQQIRHAQLLSAVRASKK